PTKGSRRPGSGQEARRDVPLKLRFCRYANVRRRISPLGLVDTEKIVVALDCGACACDDFKGLETGKANLETGPVFAVLNHSIMHLQFPLRCHYIIGASADKIKF